MRTQPATYTLTSPTLGALLANPWANGPGRFATDLAVALTAPGHSALSRLATSLDAQPGNLGRASRCDLRFLLLDTVRAAVAHDHHLMVNVTARLATAQQRATATAHHADPRPTTPTTPFVLLGAFIHELAHQTGVTAHPPRNPQTTPAKPPAPQPQTTR